MPQEDNSLNNLIQKLLSTTNSDNSKFVDELDVIKSNILSAINNATQGGKLSGLNINQDIGLSQIIGESTNVDSLNVVLGLQFLKVKKNILKAIDTETQGGKLPGLNIDDKISLSDILGESPNLNMFHALQWLRIKKNILKKVEKATEDVELEIDNKLSLNDILGSTPKQDIITSLRFFMIRQGLLKKIAKAAKDFDPQESVDSITKGVGGRSRSITRSTGARSRRPLVRSKSDTGSRTGDKIAGVGKGVGGAMAGIGKGAGEGISGFLKGLGRGLKAISNPKYLIGAGVLIALGGALFITGKALQTFVDIDWKSVLYGLATLTALGIGAALLANIGPMILIGALAIAALGAALIPAGIAFGMFSDIDWKGVWIGIGTLTALGVAAFGLSLISPAIFVGALAIAALGAAMIPAAYAFNLFSRSLEGLSSFVPILQEFVGTVVEGLIGLSSAGPGLIIAGAGILAVTGALIAFGASSAIAGLLSFFGGDPIEKFLELADKSSGLSAAAKAIDTIASALKKLDSDKVEDIGDSLKGVVKQLKSLSKLDLEDAAKLFSFLGGTKIGGAGVSAPVGVKPQAATDAAVGVKTEAMDKTSTKSKEIYSQIEGASSTAAANMMSGEGLDEKVEMHIVRAMSRSDSSMGARAGQKKLDRLKASAESGEISPEKLENIIANLLIKATEKAGLTSKSDITDLNAIHKENVLNGRREIEAEPQPVSTAMGQEITPIAKTSDISDGAAASLKTDPVDKSDNIKSREIKNDGVVTKEFIEAHLAFDKASKALMDFENDKSKTFSMTEASYENDYEESKIYDNKEDQAMFEKLSNASFNKEYDMAKEREKIVGITNEDNFQQKDAKRAGFLAANVDESKRRWIGDDAMGNKINVDSFLEESVQKVRIKQMEMLKPESRRLELETNNVSSGAEMLSKSTHIANMKADQSKQTEETSTALVDNSSRSSINNTTINEAPKHIDRTFQVFAYA